MKILNWGLIGAGDIARKRIAPALGELENCNLVSISRKNAETAESFAKEFGAEKWFADWRELIADEEIDAVYLATPVFLHKEQTIAAAEKGKHILCEKPMALNPTECEEMIAACQANNVTLGIAYYRHFYPIIKRIKEIIAADEIGKPVLAQMNAFEFFNPTPENSRYWLLEKEKSGGGPMMDFGCHRLEVLNNLFGEVTQIKSLVTKTAFEREVEDTATALLQFEGGTCASVTVTHAANEPQDTLSIFGTKGSIHIPVLNKDEIRIRNEKGEIIESHPTHPNVHLPLIEDFTNAVLENREPLVTGEIGKKIQVLEDKIYNEG
ncbi:MAG: Gfo/Idh/MocA family oxidoreductase [Pyrinomonadaceae bacterium]|nr:Gfo/Idh/MocA family oxidoreductase [Pyrinomonadaceae bacterium]